VPGVKKLERIEIELETHRSIRGANTGRRRARRLSWRETTLVFQTSRYLINAAGVSFSLCQPRRCYERTQVQWSVPHPNFTLMGNLPSDHVKVIVPETIRTV
jgi:hypothetical protein